MINCNFSDVPAQINGVIWTPPTTKTDGFILKDGIFNPETNSQASTLIISTVKLVELRGSAASQTFTCKITIGSIDQPVTAVQTVTIFNPSEDVFYQYFYGIS